MEALRSEHIAAASACGVHSLVLTAQGEVFSFGWGANGRLGHVRRPPTKLQTATLTQGLTLLARLAAQGDQTQQRLPKLIEGLRGIRVTSVSAGALHSLALTATGTVYSFGSGDRGQLGVETMVQVPQTELAQALMVSPARMPARHTHLARYWPLRGSWASAPASRFAKSGSPPRCEIHVVSASVLQHHRPAASIYVGADAPDRWLSRFVGRP